MKKNYWKIILNKIKIRKKNNWNTNYIKVDNVDLFAVIKQ